MGDLAGDHVGLIAVGHRHQHVGIVRAGLAQDGRERGAALYGADVQAVAEITQAFTIGVDDGDVVGFAGQVFGQRSADLACAENDDFHRVAFIPVAPFRADQPRAAAILISLA